MGDVDDSTLMLHQKTNNDSKIITFDIFLLNLVKFYTAGRILFDIFLSIILNT